MALTDPCSTGGIVALRFGVQDWDLETCSKTFESVCRDAFSPRKLHKVPGLRHLITLKHAAKYEITPLRNILEDQFGQNPLFGSDSCETARPAAKVAVTATDSSGKKAIVISNYSRQVMSKKKNRKRHSESLHKFLRPNIPGLELAVWEAAAATSAAPSFFKPFVHPRTSQIFLDGALYHNNPTWVVNRERKLLWPDVAEKHPDVFLSIGTGQGKDISQIAPSEPSHRRSRRR